MTHSPRVGPVRLESSQVPRFSYCMKATLMLPMYQAAGTIRENRSAGAAKALSATKELQKMERGTFDQRCDGKVYVAKWNDNAVVGIASNCVTHDRVHTVKRRVKDGVKDVSQLHLINSCNKGMGGVDLMDRLSASYRPMIRGKNGTGPYFSMQ
ncbi:piggyBac transposable element-derived protein 3-like [Macrobrachium nipponense]|uniref:piggyBac transposable element-derived protein 3-like n=1 Tax=Macrobrachium nipponense TaxID=159736 RepID=UPI0030C8A9F9